MSNSHKVVRELQGYIERYLETKNLSSVRSESEKDGLKSHLLQRYPALKRRRNLHEFIEQALRRVQKRDHGDDDAQDSDAEDLPVICSPAQINFLNNAQADMYLKKRSRSEDAKIPHQSDASIGEEGGFSVENRKRHKTGRSSLDLVTSDEVFSAGNSSALNSHGESSEDAEDREKKEALRSPGKSASFESRIRIEMGDQETNAHGSPSICSTPSFAFSATKKKMERISRSARRRKESSTGAPFSLSPSSTASSSSSSSAKDFAPQKSSIKLSDFGGIESIIHSVRELIEWPLLHPELFEYLGVEPPRGVLLFGPPGCGKSMLANAIAGELEVPFFKISGPEVVSGMSGESEERIRLLFRRAQEQAPSIVFIDEIDAIAPKRENAQREMEKRIVAQLLSCIDQMSTMQTPGISLPSSSSASSKQTSDEFPEFSDTGHPSDNVSSHSKNKGHVIVIGATNRPDSIDSGLRRTGRFDREIHLGVPNLDTREKILTVMANRLKLSGDFNLREISKLTPGYVGADLSALTKEAAAIAINRIFRTNPQLQASSSSALSSCVSFTSEPKEKSGLITNIRVPSSSRLAPQETLHQQKLLASRRDPLPITELETMSITMDDFREAIKHVQPSAKREGFATVPNVSWDQIGALADVREELQLAILQPIRRPNTYKSVGLSAPRGILLYGPPGCGKTLLAKAVANDANANFISVKGPELLNKFVGESERAVRMTFERARASAPCIVFFDELDALCPVRSSDRGGSQASERVVNQLLTEMDGVGSRQDVFIIAATNRPDIIDPAMLRPGRLDKMVYVPLPTREEREQILRTITRDTPLDDDLNLHDIAFSEACERFSGADLASLVREASVLKLKQFLIDNDLPDEFFANLDKSSSPLKVGRVDFEKALGSIVPSVSKREEARYNQLRRKILSSRIADPVAVEATGSSAKPVEII